jgi:hypothetical protein
MNAEVLREANAEYALLAAQAGRAAAYRSYVAGNLTEEEHAQHVALWNAIESLAKAVLGLEDTSPPDLRVIYGDAP